ncbi:MAG: hypothetical protein LBT01_04795 [Spirochaetaceae bacterium]|nr:hypothetical protein [Spirochaetaceae bacterium]
MNPVPLIKGKAESAAGTAYGGMKIIVVAFIVMLALLCSPPLVAEEAEAAAPAEEGVPAEAAAPEAEAEVAQSATATGGFSVFSFVQAHFGLELLESGSWEYDGTMANRIKFVLSAPLKLSFRSEILDKRAAPPKEDWTSGFTAFGFALYQRDTNSRILYGHLENWGLSARTRNIWTHAVPYFEAHRASGADLRTAAAVTVSDSFYASLGTPLLRIFEGNSTIALGFSTKVDMSILVDAEKNCVYQAGTDFYFGKSEKPKATLRFEGMFSEKTIPERKQSTWFSEKPYLPPRGIHFYALNLTFSSFYVRFSSDFAHSEVFALGEDIYANAAISIGNTPWRFSFACDGAGKYYSANDGSISGAGFRLGGKFEWFGKRNMLVVASTSLRSEATGQPFYRSASKISFRFPLMKGFLITPSRISFEFERNALDTELISDKLIAFAGINIGPLRPAVRFTLVENTSAAYGELPSPFPNFFAEHTQDYLKSDFEISAPIYFVTLKGALSYKTEPDKEGAFSASFSASIQGKLGRLSAKISKTEKNDALDYYLSWRIEKKW